MCVCVCVDVCMCDVCVCVCVCVICVCVMCVCVDVCVCVCVCVCGCLVSRCELTGLPTLAPSATLTPGAPPQEPAAGPGAAGPETVAPGHVDLGGSVPTDSAAMPCTRE